MARRESAVRRPCKGPLAIAMALLVISSDGYAQLAKPIPLRPARDSYGDAVPSYVGTVDRRPVGTFQNPWQQTLSRGYQDFGRRQNQRGVVRPVTLPGDRLRAIRRPPQAAVPGASLRFGLSEASIRKYGGFRRTAAQQAHDMPAVFTRREALLAATSFNAPVYRAFSTVGGPPSKSALEATPFLQRNDPPTTGPEPTVERHLRSGVDAAQKRLRQEAWEWFRIGKYHRAARSFETAALLDDDDIESRIGEMFSHLSLDASRTAQVVLYILTRRTENPFLPNLNPLDAYGDPLEAQRVRARIALLATPGTQSPKLRALQAVALWYVGAKEEAHAVAARLARDTGEDVYADWPALMRAASVETALPQDHPQP